MKVKFYVTSCDHKPASEANKTFYVFSDISVIRLIITAKSKVASRGRLCNHSLV